VSESTLFGAPLGYSRDGLFLWIRGLEEAWSAFAAGRAPADLDADLDRTREVFAHGATGKRLRDAVARLPAVENPFEFPPEICLNVDGSWLITPEGRILLDVLYQLRRTSSNAIEPPAQIRALSRATELHSTWYEAWASKQLGGPLSPAAIGAAVLILVNGSLDYESAFWLPNDEIARPQLRRTVLDLIGNFSTRLGEERPADSPLRSHWAFSQTSRVLSRDIERVSGSDGARVFVRPGREQHLLSDLRERLSKHDATDVQNAIGGMVAGYLEARGAFVSLGIMHERPNHTRLVVDSLTMGEAI
jgi:hypothetical protein